jgi:hypothetical protein
MTLSPLYLYQPPDESRIKSFLNNQLYFAFPNAFNDPYDCEFDIGDDLRCDKSQQGHEIELLKKLLKLHYDGGEWDAYLFGGGLTDKICDWINGRIFSSELCENIQSHFKNNVGIRCFFSDEPKSVQMWAHYAGNHKGFCVRYSGNMQARPVNYSSRAPDFYLSEFLFSGRNLSNQLLSNKDSVWAHENEKRLAILAEESQRGGRGFCRAITDPPMSMKVEAVYLGSSMEPDTKSQIIEHSLRHGIGIFQCKKGDNRAFFHLATVP